MSNKVKGMYRKLKALELSKRSVSYVSKLFQPQNIIPPNTKIKQEPVLSKSHKLMVDLGVIKPSSSGAFHLLPLGERALQKLTQVVDQEMESIGAQKMLLPLLTPRDLWTATGRWEEAGEELFKVRDRHDKEFVLSPTHEEPMTELVASVSKLSYRQLPLRLYQISSKFRDEMRPRFGLLRGKEFVMKDLYTFDGTVASAEETYEVVTAAYSRIFQRLGVKYVRAVAAAGVMGGSLSHEFLFPADVGESQLLMCSSCGHAANVETCSPDKCPACGSPSVHCSTAIEVGHTFILGTKYSLPLNATYMASTGKPELLQMGSYGLGMTRILAAAVEALSQPGELRWPVSLAPYVVCVISPKRGSKEGVAPQLTSDLCHKLESVDILKNNVIVDDRTDLTIGRRLLDAKRAGYPFIIVIGKKATQEVPEFEVHCVLENEEKCLVETSVVEFFKTLCK